MAEEKNNEDGGVMAAILQEMRALSSCQMEMRAELQSHVTREEAKLDAIISAFPAEDPRGHREYHDVACEYICDTEFSCREIYAATSKSGCEY